MSSISTNSEGRTRLPPPSWEPRTKCAPTKDRNPGQRGQTGFHSPRRQKSGAWASSAFRPLGPSRSPATSLSLAGGCRYKAQEAPRRWRTAETCPGSTRLWRSSFPSTRMPGAAPALGTNTSRIQAVLRPLPRDKRGPCLIQARAYRSSHAVSFCSAGRPGTSGATVDGRGEGVVPAEAGGAAMVSRTWRRPGRRAGRQARCGLQSPQGRAASSENGPCLNTNTAAQNPWKKKSINIYLIQ